MAPHSAVSVGAVVALAALAGAATLHRHDPLMPSESTPGVVKASRSDPYERLLGPIFVADEAARCGRLQSLEVQKQNWGQASKAVWLCYQGDATFRGGSATEESATDDSTTVARVQLALPVAASMMRIADLDGCDGVPEALRGVQDLWDLLDDPPMVCWHFAKGDAERVHARLHQSRGDLWQTTRIDMETFPDTDWPVDFADPSSRDHFFVLGPETSGTRFVTGFLAMARGLTKEPFLEKFIYDATSAIFHVSLPSGFFCTPGMVVPVYNDFGGSADAYSKSSSQVADVATPYHRSRFMVDARKLVVHHQRRGDAVKAILVARDPRQSLAGKLVEHCGQIKIAQAEQSKAFELMLDAHKKQDVIVFCYEEFLAGGVDYLSAKFTSLSVELPYLDEALNATTVIDGNTHTVNEAIRECTEDMLSYMKLCPDSPLSDDFATACKASVSS